MFTSYGMSVWVVEVGKENPGFIIDFLLLHLIKYLMECVSSKYLTKCSLISKKHVGNNDTVKVNLFCW